MKIEFIKEERIDGKVLYFTKVDNNLVEGSLEFEEDKAREKYNRIVERKSGKPIETILNSIEFEFKEAK